MRWNCTDELADAWVHRPLAGLLVRGLASTRVTPDHLTLLSCGLLHEEAHGSLEFTLGRWSKPSDVDRVLEVLPGIVERLRSLSPLYEKEKEKEASS